MDQKSMTNLFSSYSSLSSLTNATVIPVVDSITGQNRKITGLQIKDYITRSAVAGATGAQGATGPIGATGPYGPIIPATTSTLGAIKVGHNLTITTSGVLTSVLSVVGDAPPASPVSGDQWWDSQAARGYVYYNGQWVEMSPNLSGGGTAALLVHTGPTPPLSSTLWYDTVSGRTYVYYGTSWVDANPTVNYVLQPASTSTLGGVIVDGNTITVDGNGVISASGSAAVDWLAVPSSIVPTDDLTYDLGAIDKQWRSLYVGTATIYIGGVPLTLNTETSTLVIGTSTNNASTTALASEQFVINYISTATVAGSSDRLTTGSYSVVLGSDGALTLPTVLTGDTSIGTDWNTNPPGHTLTLKHNGGVNSGSGGEVKFDYGNIKLKVIKDAGITQTWTFDTDGILTVPGEIKTAPLNDLSISSEYLPTEPPTTIVISGADFVAVNLTYTQSIGDPNVWTPANYNPATDPYIQYDNGYGIWVPGFNQALYVNIGTLNVPLAQWNTNPPLGSVPPTGVYTYPGTYVHNWTFGNDGKLTLPDGGDIVDSSGTTLFKTNLSQFTNDLSIAASSLTGTALASNVVTSSLTSVGQLSGLTSTGTVHITNTDNSINADTGALQVDGGAHITKNLIAEGTIYAGKDAFTESLPNPLLVARSPANVLGGYSQIAILNNAATASGDYLVMVDGYDINGAAGDTGWVDMGMAGSNFSDARYTITPPGTGYVFASGQAGSTNVGNLVLATDGSGTTNDIVFATGGFLTVDEVVRIKNSDGSLNIKSGKINSPNLITLKAGVDSYAVEFIGYIDNGSGDGPGATLHVTEVIRGTITDGMTIYGAGLGGGWTLYYGTVLPPQGSGGTGNYFLSGANFLIASQSFNNGVSLTSKTWTFGTDGYLTGESLYLQGYLKGVDGSTGSTGQVLTRQSNGGVAWENASGSTYTLPTASTSTLGGVKIDGTSIVINNGVISSTVVGAVTLKGTWNASTNTPTLSSSLPAGVSVGWQYLVSVTGTRDIGDGSQTYTAGDIVMYDGTKWVDIPGAAGSVASFNGRTGAVTLTSNDVTTALAYTPIGYDGIVISTNAPGTQGLTYDNAGTFTFTPALNITGNAATASALQTARTINGVSFDGTGNITVTAAAGTLSGNTLNAGVTNSSLTSVGTLANLTVTNPISGSVTGSAGSVPASALTGNTLASSVVSSSLTSVGTLANLTVTNPIVGTVQNGVVTSGSYADPSWITSLSYSKLTGTPSAYTLTTATASALGGVKIGSGISITADGTISAASSWSGGTVSGTATVATFIGTATATSTQTGAVVVQGGLGVSGNVWANTLYSNDGYFRGPAGYAYIQLSTGGIAYFLSDIVLNGATSNIKGPGGYPVISVGTPSGSGNTGVKFYSTATVAGTSNSTSTATGALIVAGGAGIAGNAYVGGYVVQQTLPAFRVYGSGTTSNLSTTQNTDGKLTNANFATDYTQGSGLTTSTGIFTVPVAGLYQINLTARTSGAATSSNQIAVVKNYAGSSSVLCMVEFGASSTMIHTGASTVAKLAAGDTLVVKVLAGTVNFDANDSWSVAFLG